MTWSLAIVDDGITDAQQASARKAVAFERDYYRSVADTDEGVAATHANRVFLSALAVSRGYDVLDLKVGTPVEDVFLDTDIELSLRGLLAITDRPVGAVNLSFAGGSYPSAYADEIDALAARGTIAVAAAGNGGSRGALEGPSYPAALANVVAVGSHDGGGNPSFFSQNGPGGVDILADGEDMPGPGSRGTSFAAPQVAATVTHMQAVVRGLTGEVLGVAAMIDALQLGGAGPRSRPDPADGSTRYFLHDHARSLDYAWDRYGGTPTRALEYVASHPDLIAELGADPAAGQRHFERAGSVEGRAINFDALHYIASHGDLVGAFGLDALAGAAHYIAFGVREGRTAGFAGLGYIASYGDLIQALGASEAAGINHFITHGFREGRAVGFDGLQYVASYADLTLAFGAAPEAGGQHFIRFGWREGRERDLFDAAGYLANYPDLRAAFGADEDAATRHYLTAGFLEGRTDDQPAAAAADFLV